MFINKKLNNFPFLIYIKEIKIRFFYIFISFIFTFICSYYYSKEYIYILVKPLLNKDLHKIFICTDLIDLFLIHLKVCLFISFIF